VSSHLTREFMEHFHALPAHVQRSAQRAYKTWQQNPQHPGLHFKRVGTKQAVYSVRVGIGWRALGVLSDSTIIWFWIGSHAEYDKLLTK